MDRVAKLADLGIREERRQHREEQELTGDKPFHSSNILE